MDNRLERLAEWNTVLEDESRKRASIHSRANTEAVSGEIHREWWASVAKVLFKYRQLVEVGIDPTPPPAELIMTLFRTADILAGGTIPPYVKAAVKEGNPSPTPRERRHLQTAVAYYIAAKGGLEHMGELITVDDSNPNGTLCEWFKVQPTTARGWVQRYEPLDLGLHGCDAEKLTSMTIEAGKFYTMAGRSQAAIQ